LFFPQNSRGGYYPPVLNWTELTPHQSPAVTASPQGEAFALRVIGKQQKFSYNIIKKYL
jgi:hypothetical protein